MLKMVCLCCFLVGRILLCVWYGFLNVIRWLRCLVLIMVSVIVLNLSVVKVCVKC